MEEKVKFLRAQGRKKKRYASSIILEGVLTHEFHGWRGDSLTITVDDKESGNKIVATIIFANSIDWHPGDKIKIKSELIPSITSVVLEKREDGNRKNSN